MKNFIAFIFLSLVLIPLWIYNAQATPGIEERGAIMFISAIIIIPAFLFAFAEPLIRLEFKIINTFVTKNAEPREGRIKFNKATGFLVYILAIGIAIFIINNGVV